MTDILPEMSTVDDMWRTISEAFDPKPTPILFHLEALQASGAVIDGVPKATTELGGRDTSKDLLDSAGFPDNFTQAFLDASDNTNCAILSRAPGKTTTQLIDDRHDLKGFFIKGKSCDWGPMAGFLCQNPAFNKYGAQIFEGLTGIEYNRKKHLNYLDALYRTFKMVGAPINADKNAMVADKDTLLKLKQIAFLQIRITDMRRKWLVAQDIIKQVDLDETHPNLILGVAAGGKGSVVMEFILKKQVTGKEITWLLFFGHVYAKEEKAKTHSKIDTPQYLLPEPVELQKLDSINTDKFDTLLKNYNVTPAGDRKFYPLNGIQNPYPSYSAPEPSGESDLRYLNAVTGDYDLFAVYPIIPPADYKTMRRASEIGGNLEIREVELSKVEDQLKDQVDRKTEGAVQKDFNEKRPLFIPAAGKGFSLELTFSPDIFIEFIPRGAEIGRLESKYYGNLNETVFLASQTLNSIVASKFGGVATSPNAAFHSDEGGRPEVEDVDFDVAVFLPLSLAKKVGLKNNRILLIKTHHQLLHTFHLLKNICYLNLNIGWVMYWCLLLCEETTLNEIKKSEHLQGVIEKKYLKDLDAARKELAAARDVNTTKEELKHLVIDLLIGAENLKTSEKNEGTRSEAIVAGYQKLIDVFARFLPERKHMTSAEIMAKARELTMEVRVAMRFDLPGQG